MALGPWSNTQQLLLQTCFIWLRPTVAAASCAIKMYFFIVDICQTPSPLEAGPGIWGILSALLPLLTLWFLPWLDYTHLQVRSPLSAFPFSPSGSAPFLGLALLAPRDQARC